MEDDDARFFILLNMAQFWSKFDYCQTVQNADDLDIFVLLWYVYCGCCRR